MAIRASFSPARKEDAPVKPGHSEKTGVPMLIPCKNPISENAHSYHGERALSRTFFLS
jgi:hypothetical protein